MSLKCGIVGLPNVGKSTLFNALTKAGAKVENYPFCTIEPNTGVVEVPDDRLAQIVECIPTKRIVPATVEFVDIAGLVRGASKGEGLGNQFLGHIRSVDLIVHVVRCFEGGDVIHVEDGVDPLRDAEIIETELMLADLDVATRHRVNLGKQVRSHQKDALHEDALLAKVEAQLAAGRPVRGLDLDAGERLALKSLPFITSKPVLYCCNVGEGDAAKGNILSERVTAKALRSGESAIALCAKIEAEISDLDGVEERREFLAALGLERSGLERLARASYDLLGLETYFTAGEKETRAWTILKGTPAPKAAGVIHTDFERGFIRAEVYHFDDLMALKTEKRIKELGKLRIEGKDYIMRDGDIVHFLFNV